MSRAYKCDRCGKLYDKPPVEHAFDDKDVFLKGFYTINLETIPDAFSHSIELCWDCYKKLCDFLERKTNE